MSTLQDKMGGNMSLPFTDEVEELLEELGSPFRDWDYDGETCVACGDPAEVSLPCGQFVCRETFDSWCETATDFVDCSTCNGDNPYCELSHPYQVMGG